MKKILVIGGIAAATLLFGGWALAQSGGHGPGGFGPGGIGMHGQMGPGKGQMGHGMRGQMGPGMMGMGEGKGGHQGHSGSDAHKGAAGDDSASSLAFAAANQKMHRDMAITFSGDPDTDFARGMIPHHQGAIDMAKIVIAFGKDPEIRKLAEEIVKAQETEIDFMRSWVRKRGQ